MENPQRRDGPESTTEMRSPAPRELSDKYVYKYPRNIISWFFLAQRHNYVKSILHRSINLDIGSSENKITPESLSVDLTKRKRPDVVASALALPFRQGVFDSCTMLEVIEHMSPQRQEAALREARRVLRKGGQFIISTPNLMYGLFNIVWWAWEKTAGRQWLHEHVGMLDTQRLVRILLRSGFDVVSNKRIAVFDRIIETKCSK